MIIPHAKAEEAAAVLEVPLTGLTSEAMNKAYRQKTKDCHPDHHGSTQLQLWARVSWAKEALTHWIKNHPVEVAQEAPQVKGTCRACNGEGRVDVVKRSFGKPLKMQCVMCRGLGEVLPVEDNGDD